MRPGDLLTPCELDVLRCIAEGDTNRAIGRKLFYTPDSVKHIIGGIAHKLHAYNRAHVVHRAWQLDYLTKEGT